MHILSPDDNSKRGLKYEVKTVKIKYFGFRLLSFSYRSGRPRVKSGEFGNILSVYCGRSLGRGLNSHVSPPMNSLNG